MPIYLEFAPIGMMEASNKNKEESDDEDQEQIDNDNKESRAKTVFIKNLNFITKEE